MVMIRLDELQHHGVKGMKWGIRRYQNEDGSLTTEGEKRYEKSLSKVYDGLDDKDDYVIPAGTTVSRRSNSDKEGVFSNKKVTYTYDEDSADDGFYKQFGKKVTEFETVGDLKMAGKTILGKALVNRLMSADEEGLDAMGAIYEQREIDYRRQLGEDYVSSSELFKAPFNPSDKNIKALMGVGGDLVGQMVGAKRNDKIDAKFKKRGMRDTDTYLNDMGLDVVQQLTDAGYGGMRDYHDYGSAAGVNTPTVIFNPEDRLRRRRERIDD